MTIEVCTSLVYDIYLVGIKNYNIEPFFNNYKNIRRIMI